MKALRAGFQIHLAKPIDPAELVTTIAALAKRFVTRNADDLSDSALHRPGRRHAPRVADVHSSVLECDRVLALPESTLAITKG